MRAGNAGRPVTPPLSVSAPLFPTSVCTGRAQIHQAWHCLPVLRLRCQKDSLGTPPPFLTVELVPGGPGGVGRPVSRLVFEVGSRLLVVSGFHLAFAMVQGAVLLPNSFLQA